LHKKYWPGWEGETEVREMMMMQQDLAAKA
jgi:hypothetical protein